MGCVVGLFGCGGSGVSEDAVVLAVVLVVCVWSVPGFGGCWEWWVLSVIVFGRGEWFGGGFVWG